MHAARFLAGLILAAALISPFSALAFPQTGQLSPAEATELVKSQAGLTFLDVRTQGEFAEGHAAGAVHIPVDQLAGRIAEVPAGPVLIVCRSGMRAGNAYRMLVNSGRAPESLWFLRGFTDYSAGTPSFR